MNGRSLSTRRSTYAVLFSPAVILLLGCAAALLILPGCVSAQKRIDASALQIHAEAESACVDLGRALDGGDVGPKAEPLVRSALQRLETISAATDVIREEVQHVHDDVPAWRTLLGWLPWVAGVGGVVALLAYSGFLPLVLVLLLHVWHWLLALLRLIRQPAWMHTLTDTLKAKLPEPPEPPYAA